VPTTKFDAYNTGFETGELTSCAGSSGDVTLSTLTKHSGSYAAKLVSTGATPAFLDISSTPAPQHSFVLYLYFDSLPPGLDNLLTVFASVGGNGRGAGFVYDVADGRFHAWVADPTSHFGTAAPLTIATGQWYRVACRVTFDTTTLDWKSDIQVAVGDADYSATGGQAAGNGASAQPDKVNVGVNAAPGAPGFTMYVDDVLWHNNNQGSIDYPMPAVSSVGITMKLEGTHNTPSIFRDDSGNSPPVNPQLRVDEFPIGFGGADYYRQESVNSGAYIEVYSGSGMPDTTWLWGGRLIGVHNLNEIPTSIFDSATAQLAVQSPDTGWSASTALHSSRHTDQQLLNVGSLIFSFFGHINDPDPTLAAYVDHFRVRAGYAQHVPPSPSGFSYVQHQNLMLEITYAPVTGIREGGEEHERRPVTLRQANWRVHPWTMR